MFKSLLFLFTIWVILLAIPLSPFEEIKLMEDEITIYVKGEVQQEQYLTLAPHSQVKDILEEITLSENADTGCLDLNRYLIDNDTITIPVKSEILCVSINSATLDMLVTLPGIGEVTAQKIIDYRQLHGSFLEISEIMEVKGIGQSKYEKIKELICL